MADQIRREVGKDGRVLLTNAPLPPQRGASGNPSLDALIEATRFDRSKYAPVEDGGVDAALTDAKQYLADPTTFGYQLDVNRKASQPTAEEGRLRDSARIAPVMAEAARGALIPASFLGGPVGMAAGGAMTLDALDDLINDPSIQNAIPAALGALPFVKPIRSAMKARSEAKAVQQMRNTYGAGDMGATVAREQPYKDIPANVSNWTGPAAVQTPVSRLPPKSGLSQFGPDAQAAQMEGKASRARGMRAWAERKAAEKNPNVAALADPTDWRQIPPRVASKANFVKRYANTSQQDMAQMLGERDYNFGELGVKIKRLKKPIYPEGDSRTDKLVAAMRQREKLMGYKD